MRCLALLDLLDQTEIDRYIYREREGETESESSGYCGSSREIVGIKGTKVINLRISYRA